jgi:drug/metabolite transporter (DMT)-like permease
VGVAVSSVLFYAALGRIGAARTTALFATSGLFGVALAAALLREPLGLVHLAAAALSALGVAALLAGSKP